MPTHAEKRVLPYQPQQMYDLVADIGRYPEFLPWCVASRVRKREGEEGRLIVADLVIGFRMIREGMWPRVVGRDIGAAVEKALKKLCDGRTSTEDALPLLEEWGEKREKRVKDKGAHEDLMECIRLVLAQALHEGVGSSPTTDDSRPIEDPFRPCEWKAPGGQERHPPGPAGRWRK